MKILTILTFYAPHWTGLTAHAVRAAEELAARGHEVTVLTTRHSPELPRDERRNGVRIVRLVPVGRFSRGLVTPAFPYAAAQLIAQHDVVHIHTPLPESLLVAAECRALGKPLLMTHHGDVVMPAGAFNQAVQRIAFQILRATCALADAITAYSRDYAEHSPLLRPFMGKMSYVYPPVVIPAPDRHEIARWRAELALEGKQLIGFAGRWVEEKGFDYLLEALPLLRRTNPDAHLVYAGEKNVVYDNFYAKCQALIDPIQEHITFLGLLRDPQRLADFYGMCDLVAVPSRTDNMPLVEVEALMCGTPLVVSDIPGARVIVQVSGYGRLVPSGNPPALAAALSETLRDRAQYVPDHDRVCQLFDMRHSIDQYEGMMRDLVGRRRAGRSGGTAA